MKRNLLIFLIACLLTGLWGINWPAAAGDIKTRMLDRLPEILELKAKGIFGETNRGYLAFTGSAREGAEILNAENLDRKAVYEKIAKQQGTTVEVVGALRAEQIEKRAKPGEWLQDAEGKWYQK